MAIAVCSSIATCFKMDGVFKPPGAKRIGRRIIASLVCTLVDLKLLPAIVKHLGHKCHSVQLSEAKRKFSGPSTLKDNWTEWHLCPRCFTIAGRSFRSTSVHTRLAIILRPIRFAPGSLKTPSTSKHVAMEEHTAIAMQGVCYIGKYHGSSRSTAVESSSLA